MDQRRSTLQTLPDAIFSDSRLARIYDPLDGDRADLDLYVTLAEEFGARSVLDLGCGTGTLCCRLASLGISAVGIDPAHASLEVARMKPHADAVTWILGDASDAPALDVDLATMTGNVAQVFLGDDELTEALGHLRRSVRPGGIVAFEVRDPDRQAWASWTREHTWVRTHIAGSGHVISWVDVIDVSPPFVSFRWTFQFEDTGEELTSDSTLRFRSLDEIETSVRTSGLVVTEVRDAPDRPGLEFVVICERRDR